LSLSFLVVGKSGERKTAADKMLGRVLDDWERERKDEMQGDIKRNIAARDGWFAVQEGIKAAIRTAARKKSAEADELIKRLTDHRLKQPPELIAPRLRYENVTPEALAHCLAKGHPSAALWSDEGGMVTGSHGMGKDSLLGFLSGLNRLWDGGSIHHDR
jgi:putative DNA primase/helicase